MMTAEDKPLVSVDKLIVKPTSPRHFGHRPWVVLFPSEDLRDLSKMERALLFTLILEASRRDYLLRAHRSSLRGHYGRNHIATILKNLQDRGIILRRGEWLYLNPYCVYAGPAACFSTAADWWEYYKKQPEEEGQAEGGEE